MARQARASRQTDVLEDINWKIRHLRCQFAICVAMEFLKPTARTRKITGPTSIDWDSKGTQFCWRQMNYFYLSISSYLLCFSPKSRQHFNFDDLFCVRHVAVPIGILAMATPTVGHNDGTESDLRQTNSICSLSDNKRKWTGPSLDSEETE